MRRVFKSLLAVLIAVAVMIATQPLLAEGVKLRATSFIPVQTTLGELSDSQLERALVSEIHRLADKAFAEIKARDPHAKVTQLKKVERAVVHRLKETGKLVSLARSLNPKIGISVVATEVLVTALGFGLMSTGQVLAGTAVLNFPSAPLLLSVMLAYEVQKIKWQIGRELKTSIRELEKIRKEVIGYNVKNKITTLVLQDQDVQRELELVTKQVSGKKHAPEIVSLKEVEKVIARTAEGESFLAHAYHERGNKEIYASLLIQYLNDSPDSLTNLLTDMAARESTDTEALKSPELRKHLMEISDIQKHIERELKAARQEISATKKKVRRGEMSREAGVEARLHLKSEVARLNEVRIQTFRHQYALLLSAKEFYLNGNNSELKKIVSKNKMELAELRVDGSFERIRKLSNATQLPAEFSVEQASQVIRSCQQIFAAAN